MRTGDKQANFYIFPPEVNVTYSSFTLLIKFWGKLSGKRGYYQPLRGADPEAGACHPSPMASTPTRAGSILLPAAAACKYLTG